MIVKFLKHNPLCSCIKGACCIICVFGMCLCACVLGSTWFCNPMDCSLVKLLCPCDSPGKNTAVGWHFLLQGTCQPRDQTHTVSCVSGNSRWILHQGATSETPIFGIFSSIIFTLLAVLYFFWTFHLILKTIYKILLLILFYITTVYLIYISSMQLNNCSLLLSSIVYSPGFFFLISCLVVFNNIDHNIGLLNELIHIHFSSMLR